VAGIGLGRSMVRLYGEFFDFPTLRYTMSWVLVAIAVGVSALAAGAGALTAVRRAAMLPPAEAMRPEPPATFRPGPLERMGIGRVLPPAGRMILRNVERRPLRSALSALGVAFSVAILVIGLFMFDGIDYMMDLQFRVAQREDLSLTFHQPLSRSVGYDLTRLDGVTRVELARTVPVRLRAGHREREVAVTGLQPDARLRRIVTAAGGVHPLPPEGVVLSAILADQLGVSAGDVVTAEVLEGARPTARVVVTGVVEDFLGLSAYMRLDALHRLARGAPAVTGAYLQVAENARASLNERLKRLPVVAGVASPAQMLESFEDQLAESLFVAIFFILGFSAMIAVAVLYNGARISFSERSRELASLRVLGFSRREVAVLLFGEQALITAAGIPLGWVLGYLLAAAVASGLETEAYRIPLIVSTSTYVWSTLATILAAVVSAWIVRGRLNRMDLIAVLKTRE
ncbi:MAG TPA: FtsX-like permease family protein, partial [Gemmatimonadaceae bacterium]|nr:FtsX-like permease family protein [Gemmatimonadaceae bacterium]